MKLTHLWPIQDRLELARRIQAGQARKDEDTGQIILTWPNEYVNRATGRKYRPHHEEEERWQKDRSKRYYLAKGGEGSGKSAAGIIRDLEYLKLGNVKGILTSPDLPHFKKSLWPEFRDWCPWHMVVPNQQYRGRPDWEPHDPFTLTFRNGSQIICGGIEDPKGWEGPNMHFAHFDEARRKKEPDALKTLDGRVRLDLPNGDPPALWITTTPKKHWLYDYFGPWEQPGEDPRQEFKADSLVITLDTEDNERDGNVTAGFTRKRGQSLNEAEKRVLLKGEWEDIEDVERFLASILWWDNCREDLPPLTRHNPLVLGVDGAESNDNFALVAVSRHPDRSRNQDVAIRYSRVWEPGGKLLDFEEIEREIYQFCRANNVVHVAFDKYQLLYMMERLYKKGIPTESFNQGPERAEADKQFLDMIVARHIVHDGTHDKLRQHLDNADKKKGQDGKLRLVKREQSLKIDLAVATSMAVARCLYLNLYG